jgi:hypothetical protein
MHRRLRGAKFSEYLSTYALLKGVGIHPTAVIERRQAVEGYGWFVRDACDAGTVLCVLPLALAVSARNGLASGSPLRTEAFDACRAPHGGPGVPGMLRTLLGCDGWAALAWRIALEQGVQASPLWWGWLGSLPPHELLRQHRAMCVQHCSASAATVPLVPHLEHLQQCLAKETLAAYEAASRALPIAPPFARFDWAVQIVLSRSLLFPSHSAVLSAGDTDGAEDLELTILPFFDLVNGASGSQIANAEIEIAMDVGELPAWYKDDVLKSRLPAPPFAVLTTTQPLLPADQVLMHYQCPSDVSALAPGIADAAMLCTALRFSFLR